VTLHVSLVLLRQDEHKHITTLCSALRVPIAAHCHAHCVCVCVCVFLEILSVHSGQKTTVSLRTSLCLFSGRMLTSADVNLIFFISVFNTTQMLNVDFPEPACAVARPMTHHCKHHSQQVLMSRLPKLRTKLSRKVLVKNTLSSSK